MQPNYKKNPNKYLKPRCYSKLKQLIKHKNLSIGFFNFLEN